MARNTQNLKPQNTKKSSHNFQKFTVIPSKEEMWLANFMWRSGIAVTWGTFQRHKEWEEL